MATPRKQLSAHPSRLADRDLARPLGNTGPLAVRILTGRTAYPVRPVQSPRFLIGAGSSCHLKLGGEMPMVHSIITSDETGARIENLVPDPPLKVDGQECREADLCIGTRFEIGPFQLELAAAEAVRSAAAETNSPPQPASSDEFRPAADLMEPAVQGDAVPVADELAPAPEDLSIHELVDRLEAALARMEEVEQERRRGLSALLETIARSAGNAAPLPSAPSPSLDSLDPPAQRRSA